MRYFGAVRGTGRFASEDIEYRGVLFPAGTFIAPSMATANVDPAVFGPEPGTFDITREPSGQPQLTFGSGIHYCLGAALARAELQEALPILARRLPDLRRRRPRHLEAQHRRHLRPRPPPRHLHPHPHPHLHLTAAFPNC